MRRSLTICVLASLILLPLAGCGDSSATPNDEAETSTEGVPVGDGDGDSSTGDGEPSTGTGDGDPSTGDGDGDGEPGTGDGDGEPVPGECVETACAGKFYQCGDCEDNDGDGKIDSNDPECWGPCDNNEAGFRGNIPGQGHSPCTSMDCYFDSDSGAGNDACYWTHSCDPSEPNPSSCTYNANSTIPGSGGLNCETAQQTQSEECIDICGPLTPNGCDCFGCCDVQFEGQTHTIYLGTGDGAGTCSLAQLGDPDKCAPCLQVEACLNPCDAGDCEICIGQTKIPDGCEEAGCPDGVASCDPVNNSADCPNQGICVTGCCVPPPA